MARRYPKASRPFTKFIKLTLGNYLRILFNLRIDNRQLKGLKPPYIILANHTNFWDPFLLSVCIPDPVHFVTSDTYFRHPLLRILLRFVGAIPKIKSVSDPTSIKNIFSIVKNGGVIGIYPEGRRNWDGTTLPLLYSTAKLIKSLKLPVVSVLSIGACLSMPRWAKKARRGILSLECRKVLDSGDCASMTIDGIYDSITRSLAFDEYEYQKRHMIPFRGARLAENLQYFLFTCPECRSMNGMKSAGHEFYCSCCGYRVSYDEFGFFKKSSGNLYFDNPPDWNKWQLELLASTIGTGAEGSTAKALLEEDDIDASMIDKTENQTDLSNGRLELYPERLCFTAVPGKQLHFSLSEIYGENVQYNNLLEFYKGNILYRFGRKKTGISAYKWARAIEFAKR